MSECWAATLDAFRRIEYTGYSWVVLCKGGRLMRKLAVVGLVAVLVSGVAMMAAAKHMQHGKAAGARRQ